MTGPTQLIGTSSDSASLLNREASTPASSALTPLQSQVDQIVGDFSHQATDWKSLSAMVAGGMAYRWARIGALSSVGKVFSIGLGLGTEVTAFEVTNRSLSHLTGEGVQNPNLWKWQGQGGLRQGLFSSLVTFGSLKGAGRLAQGENIVIQHLLQDTGMVLAHHISGQWGITPSPTGTLAEQFLQAEATNLQLGAGMALGHALSGGRLLSIEKGLDLQLSSQEKNTWDPFPRLFPEMVFAMAGSQALEEDPSSTGKKGILAMDAPADGSGGRGGRKKGLKKTDLEDYRAATEDLSSSAEKDTTDASTLQILRGSTFINFKKVLASYARSHLGTVISLTRLAERGHRWALEVLSEASKTGQYAANALKGMATRGLSTAFDALGRAAAAENSSGLIQILHQFSLKGSQRARTILKNMRVVPLMDDPDSKGPRIYGLLLLALNENKEALHLLVQKAKTEPLAVEALFKMASKGRPEAQKILAKLDPQWLVRASQENGFFSLALFQLAKYGNPAAQIGLMETAKDKWGPFFLMALLSKEGHPWATEWLTIQAETNPMAQRLLPVLAGEGHRNAQEILQNKKASEADDPEGNGGDSAKSLFSMDLGLATLFGDKQSHGNEILSSGISLPDLLPEIGHGFWSKALPLIGLGVLIAAGIGISAWRRRAKWEAWYQNSPYSKMFIQLEDEDREILKPLFGGKEVPRVLTGRDWLRIEKASFHQAHVMQGGVVYVKSSRPLDLYNKIQEHAQVLAKKETSSGKEDNLAEDEGDAPALLTWSRPVDSKNGKGQLISLFDYRENQGLRTVYENLRDSFPSQRDLGEFLRASMADSDSWIRERHIQVYEIHVKSLLRMNHRRLAPWMIEEIEKGMALLHSLRRDPVLNVKSTASVVYHHLQDFIPKYLPTFAEKN